MIRTAGILLLGVLTVALAACGTSPKNNPPPPPPPPPPASNTPFWAQWGSNPQHTGSVGTAGQLLTSKHADIVYDPFVPQEKAANEPIFGEAVLTVHEQAPLTDGNDVYMATKSGSYTACSPAGNWVNGVACGPNAWNTMVWALASRTPSIGVL